MKGSVRKKRKNAWSYRIDLGTVDGKRKQVEKGGFKTEREATKAMQDVLYHLNKHRQTMWRTRKFPFTPYTRSSSSVRARPPRAYATFEAILIPSIGTISRMSSGRCMSTRSRIPCSSTS